ncbi:phage tail protein I [Lysinibacillus fusiformis]|uniref:phage tail protein I n=1 Tax=Lysinibacillus fusiformis TaxID=28031 RepID=UPI0035C12D81|nr:phage tail protein I [Lysinibacillus fusiformis]
MDSDLLKLLPRSLRQDPVLVAIAEAVEIQLKQAYQEAEDIYNLVDSDKVPESLLDLLAYEKHVDFYEVGLPVTQKRALVKASVKWHRKKGTRGAIEDVVSIIYKNAQVFEWFEYGGEEYRFKIEVEEPFIANEDMKRLKKMIEATKNKRSWLEYVAVKMQQTQYIELESNKSYYPVYLPICGELYCEGVPGIGSNKTVEIETKKYTYPVYMPICGEIYTNEVIDQW